MKINRISRILINICPESEVALLSYRKDMVKSLAICTTGMFIAFFIILIFFIKFGPPTLQTALLVAGINFFIFVTIHIASIYRYSKDERDGLKVWSMVRSDLIKHPLISAVSCNANELSPNDADIVFLKKLCANKLREYINELREERETLERKLDLDLVY